MSSTQAPADPAPEPDLADQSHDGFVKFVFTHPDEAIGFLRAYLPEPLPDVCDWASLEILPSAYVSERLGQSHGDILYRIRVADVETWIHVIVEHQSTPSKVPMPYRCYGYIKQSWDAPPNHAKPTEKDTSSQLPPAFPAFPAFPTFPLSPVVTFLIHQGPSPYTGPTSLRQLIASTGNPDADAILARYTPQFDIIVIDLALPEPRLDGTTIGKTALELMAAVRRGEGAAFLEAHKHQLATDLERVAIAMLTYLISTPSGVSYKQIETTANKLPDPLRKETMTVAQELMQKGRQEGRQEGEKRLLRAQQTDVLEALKLRFKRVPAGLRDAVQSIDSTKKLHALHRAAILSDSLDAFAENL